MFLNKAFEDLRDLIDKTCVIKLKPFKIFQNSNHHTTVKFLCFTDALFPKPLILAPLVRFLEGFTNKIKCKCPSKLPEHPLQWNNEAEAAFTAAK
ncbi:hypothetical protein CEXT_61341 [Caerostris extrusa]|uniref:Uncharacterized protein n=1 Tax=Caerostris extrusa TaxID=172846 RepID=A0AAV4Q7N9_CAEEX|nr:hypothetical protein CEXT_61341 [Caerostris extrusa]